MTDTVPKEIPPPAPFAWIMRPIEFALKWGFLGVSLLLLLVFANRLGFQVEVSKLFGQDISIKQVTEVVETNDEQVANLRATVEKLREDLVTLAQSIDSSAPFALSVDQIRELPTEQGAVTQPVVKRAPISGEGVIWLGRYENGAWIEGTVGRLSELPAPSDLVDKTLTLDTKVNVRADFPAPVDAGYYEAIPSKGIANPDQRITIVSPPRAYARESGTQYWARVQTTFDPKSAASDF